MDDVLAFSFNIELLRQLEKLASNSFTFKGRELDPARRVVVGCVSNLYLLALDPYNYECAYNCIRSMLTLAIDNRKIPENIKTLARKSSH